MHIGSGLNTVSSMYRQQKGNNMKTPASGEKTFYTAETPKVYQIFTTDNMLWTGGNGTGLSYCLKYADDSTDENPVVLAKGVDENGKEFEQRIYINDVNPSSATVVEMRALEAHYKVEKQGGFTSLPLEAGNMGLNDRRDFISMFKKSIEDLKANNRTYQFADEKTKKQIAYISDYYLQTVPESVKAAWQETLEETGFNPFQTDVTSTLTQLSVEQDFLTGGDDNIFGETKESCLAAIDKVLERIENPLAAVTEERAAYLQQEKEFYTVLASKIRE